MPTYYDPGVIFFPEDFVPTTRPARLSSQRELEQLQTGDFKSSHPKIAAYWQRYNDLANKILEGGLTEEELEQLGGSLRYGMSFNEVQRAVDIGKAMGHDHRESQVTWIARTTQLTIAFKEAR